jgi:glutamine synthetase
MPSTPTQHTHTHTQVPVEKCGYYEDRRPASNLDPYVVTRLIVETTLLM